MRITRRTLLRTAAAAGMALAAPALHAQPRAKKFRTALIGSGWWGNVISEMAMAHGSVDIRAVCDEAHAPPAQTKTSRRLGTPTPSMHR